MRLFFLPSASRCGTEGSIAGSASVTLRILFLAGDKLHALPVL